MAAACWRGAEYVGPFVDLVHGGPTALDTRAALLWDDDHLYVGFRVEQPDVVATLTERDAHVWLDDDVELFIAGPDAYYELEVNALNTVYEALFAWDDAGLDLDLPGAAPFDGVDHRHPRGPRTGYFGFDLPGLRTAVHVDDPWWTVEIAVPWAGLAVLAGGRALPPHEGDEWPIALSRFNTRRYGDGDSGGWALAAHGVWDSHIPERFPVVRFTQERSR